MAAMAFREPNQVKWMGIRPGRNGTQIANSSSANNSTTVMWTVSAGKTGFLTYFSFSWRFTATGQTVWLVVRNAADVEQYSLILVASGAGDQGANSCAFAFPIEIPAGYDIAVVSDTAGAAAKATIIGWEE